MSIKAPISLFAGGDISTKNLWLAESVLDILLEQKYVTVKDAVGSERRKLDRAFIV